MMQRKIVKLENSDLLVFSIVEVGDAVAPYVADVSFVKINFLGRWVDITNPVLMDADACRALQAEIIKEYLDGK